MATLFLNFFSAFWLFLFPVKVNAFLLIRIKPLLRIVAELLTHRTALPFLFLKKGFNLSPAVAWKVFFIPPLFYWPAFVPILNTDRTVL